MKVNFPFYYRPIIPLLLAYICGILFARMYPGMGIWVCTFIVILIGYIFIRIFQKKSASVVPLILFLGLGYLSIDPWVGHRFPPNHIIHYTDESYDQLIGIVQEKPVIDNHIQKILLKTESIEKDGKRISTQGLLKITVTGNQIPGYGVGDRLSFSGKIRSIRNFGNPGGFDYKNYMAFQSIWATAYVRQDSLRVIGQADNLTLFQRIEKIRTQISDVINRESHEDVKQVMNALIIGEKDQIPPEIQDAFNRTGMGHLLAISGLHMGIVAGIFLFIFRFVITRFRFFLNHGWVNKTSALLTIFPVLLYGMIAGMSPSTQRAVIMVLVFLMTFWFAKEQDAVNTLAIAALIILIIDPPSLFSPSFQLSFTAVLSIIYGIRMIQSNVSAIKPLWRWLILFFVTSLSAIIGTMPLVLKYFNQISFVGIVANLVFIPLIGFICVPFGLLSVFIYQLSYPISQVLMALASGVLFYSIVLMKEISDFSFVSKKFFTPSHLEMICFYVLLWILCYGRHQLKETRYLRIVAIVVIFISVGDGLYWVYQRYWNNKLRITVLDVGQGSSALIEFPKGFCMLIDGGGFYNHSAFDVGEKVVAPVLWQRKILTVDTVVLSHPNNDHINGLLYILDHFRVKTVWQNNEAANTASYTEFAQLISKHSIAMPNYRYLPPSTTINTVTVKILYPPKDFLDRKQTETWRNENNNSLVIQIQYGDFSMIFPGDITAEAEREIVSLFKKEHISSDIILAPHHGSKTSSSDLFLDQVKPNIVIISVGWQNRFHFPHQTVLKRYQDRNCQIYRTDIHGSIRIISDGNHTEIIPYYLR